MYVLLLCFSLSVVCVFCCHMCCFDCKCKSLNRLGENRTDRKQNRKASRKTKKHRNTWYPAQNPTANKCNMFVSRRFVGWISCISVFLCSLFFSKLFCSVFCLFCFRLVYLSCCINNRTHTYTNIKQTHNKLR